MRNKGYVGESSVEITSIDKVSTADTERLSTGFSEFDCVLGGGLMSGSAVLIGGNPGAGKSTLLLQVLSNIAQNNKVLYISGEESASQIAQRANRLDIATKYLDLLIESSTDRILASLAQHRPKVAVIDSIQVMFMAQQTSAPGSVAQVRESTAALVQYAKQNQIVLFIVGHITKDGNLAGPKVLEHIIDCFLMMEICSDSRFRTMRSVKNRYGAAGELGIFSMGEKGLIGVKNPSAIFLSRAEKQSSGSVITVLWEGTRPMLIEIQALVTETPYNPRRITVGFDSNRNAMVVAILLRHGSVAISNYDIYVNVVGGIKIEETAADLAVLLSMFSSFRNVIVPIDCLCFGELGLAGEVRPVANGQQRLVEAGRQGFKNAIIPFANKPRTKSKIKVYAVKNVREALEVFEQICQ